MLLGCMIHSCGWFWDFVQLSLFLPGGLRHVVSIYHQYLVKAHNKSCWEVPFRQVVHQKVLNPRNVLGLLVGAFFLHLVIFGIVFGLPT